jgi:hypothetical protein
MEVEVISGFLILILSLNILIYSQKMEPNEME